MADHSAGTFWRDRASLKPCPFCGEPAKAYFVNGDVMIACSAMNEKYPCPASGYLLSEFDEELAEHIWNRRTVAKHPTKKSLSERFGLFAAAGAILACGPGLAAYLAVRMWQRLTGGK